MGDSHWMMNFSVDFLLSKLLIELSLIDEQWFIPTEINYMDFINTNSASYQSFTQDLFQVRTLSLV